MKLNALTHSRDTDAGHPPTCGRRTSVQECRPAERVVLDLELPHLAIARALKRQDDPAIWQEYARTRDQAGFLEVLSRLSGRYCTQQTHFRDPTRSTEWQHDLVAVPFLLPAASWPVAAPAVDDRAGAGSLMGELQHWAGDEQPAKLVLGCVKYVDLCRWSPVTQQSYLQLLAGERRDVSSLPGGIATHVPSGLVQLAFAVGSVRCWNAPPQVPQGLNSPAADWAFRARTASCLSYINQCQIGPEHVLLPAPLSEAVSNGLRLWFKELAHQGVVRAWDVRVGPNDVVYQELSCTDEELGTMLLPLRLHQVGPDAPAPFMAEMELHFGPPSPAGACAKPRHPYLH